jgi:hypothetical protein
MKRIHGKKHTAAVIVVLMLIAFTFTGCFGGRTRKNLLNYFGESKVQSARLYVISQKDGQFEELKSSRVPELVERLESMQLKTKAFHTDYYWGGQFGIELSLEDGTYLTYDGTKLEHRRRSRESGDRDNIESVFAEVTNMKFWEEMDDFFRMAQAIPMR